MTAPISRSAAITAVGAANAAGRAVEVTTLDGHTQHGTARWADSDQTKLALFSVVSAPPIESTRDSDGRNHLTDANGVTFAYPPAEAAGLSDSQLYDFLMQFRGQHPRPWSIPGGSLWLTDEPLGGPDDWYAVRSATVYVDLAQVATIVSSTNWGADPNLGTVAVQTPAGVHRERDPGWTFGTGLE